MTRGGDPLQCATPPYGPGSGKTVHPAAPGHDRAQHSRTGWRAPRRRGPRGNCHHTKRRTPGILSGGLFNLFVQGQGVAAISSHGTPMLLDCSQQPTFVDPQAAVCGSANLQPQIKSAFTAGAIYRARLGRGLPAGLLRPGLRRRSAQRGPAPRRRRLSRPDRRRSALAGPRRRRASGPDQFWPGPADDERPGPINTDRASRRRVAGPIESFPMPPRRHPHTAPTPPRRAPPPRWHRPADPRVGLPTGSFPRGPR